MDTGQNQGALIWHIVYDIKSVVRGIWYILHGVWEFPKIKWPQCRPQKTGDLILRCFKHPKFTETAHVSAHDTYVMHTGTQSHTSIRMRMHPCGFANIWAVRRRTALMLLLAACCLLPPPDGGDGWAEELEEGEVLEKEDEDFSLCQKR